MLQTWLNWQNRRPLPYKFAVVDVTEISERTREIVAYLADQIILAHGNPQMIIEDCQKLLADVRYNQDTWLAIIKDYLNSYILPTTDRGSVEVGNFGEVLAAALLVEFEQFWFPIYKLRYREKKNWAMRLTDFCVIRVQNVSRPLVSYIEVKTKSSGLDRNLALDGHESLKKGLEGNGNLSNGEILHFMQASLYERGMVREARFLGDIKLGKITYETRHDLFLIHHKEKWTDEILDKLETYPIDPRLFDFSIKVVLIAQLRKIINGAYDYCAVSTLSQLREMDKQEYLQQAYEQLETLSSDSKFQGDLAQLRARSIQEELLPEQPDIHFTFDAQIVWQRCGYIFSESTRILREGYENGTLVREIASKEKQLLQWIKTAAQSFEFLAKFADDDEKEMLLLSAAICYHVSGYHANAQCIANMIETIHLSSIPQEEAVDARLVLYFRQASVSFLKRNIAPLQQRTQQALTFISGLQEKVVSSLAEGTASLTDVLHLAAHTSFHQALSDFASYSIAGDPAQLSAARDKLQKSYTYFQQVRDVRLGTLVSELRTIFDLFEGQGTWSSIGRYAAPLLENNIWRAYLRNLAFENIVEFWSSQLKALQSGLLTTDESFIVQMPTSAGKTFIAELSLLAHLTRQEQKRCLYIAPYRALVNEVMSKLTATLGSVGYRISNLAGGFEFDAFQNFLLKESDVLVATPEKVELLFRTHPDYFDDISTIVIDEGHILDEGIATPHELPPNKTLLDDLKRNGVLGRGTLLEFLITRLKEKLPRARFMFLSAVMPEINIDDFVTWLSEKKQEPLRIDRTERPSRQTMATFRWLQGLPEKGGYNGRLEYINLPTLPDGRKPFVPYFLQRAKYLTGEYTPTGKQQQKTWPTSVENKAQSTALLAVRFATTGPVLVFCAQPSDTKDVVNNIILTLKYVSASEQLLNESLQYIPRPAFESFDLAMEWLGEKHPLTRGLHYGVGLHYGPLPDPVRQAVEDDFRSGNIKILVSTNTLGQGVNMPVKTAIIYSLERIYWDEKNKKQVHQPIKKRDFWNICGRAGRAGKETEGQIIFVVSSPHDNKLLTQFKHEENIEGVASALYKLLQALIEKRISQDDLIGYLDSYTLALLAEEIIDTQDETTIRAFLGTSLVGVQALRSGVDLVPLVSAVKQTALWVDEQIPDKSTQKIFASTGLQVASCKTLEQEIDAFLQAYSSSELDGKKDNFSLDDHLLEAAFRACQNISEMKLKDTISYRGPEDEFDLVKDWIAGKPVSEIRTKYWSEGPEDGFGDYVADRLIYKLPWGMNGFLSILASKLRREISDLPVSWQHLSSMVKFGVNSPVACWVSSFVLSSRRLALKLADLYPPENGISIPDFIKWIVNLPTEFILQELEGSKAEKRRLLNRINQIVSDDYQLQFIRRRKRKLESPVKGISYNNRVLGALKVRERDQLVLEREPDNLDDVNAIRVVFDSYHIGYVQRDTARILSREMLVGRTFLAYAKTVRPPTGTYPIPHIEMVIEAEDR